MHPSVDISAYVFMSSSTHDFDIDPDPDHVKSSLKVVADDVELSVVHTLDVLSSVR